MTWVVKAWKPDAFAARLAALEALGTELREEVRHRRSASEPEITARKGRATMHDSPLSELFKATSAPAARRSAPGDRFAHSGAHAAGARAAVRAPRHVT